MKEKGKGKGGREGNTSWSIDLRDTPLPLSGMYLLNRRKNWTRRKRATVEEGALLQMGYYLWSNHFGDDGLRKRDQLHLKDSSDQIGETRFRKTNAQAQPHGEEQRKKSERFRVRGLQSARKPHKAGSSSASGEKVCI